MSVPKKRVTSDLAASKTSPTLVEFQNKNASLPDWRLQLQNAVQQRRGGASSDQERSFPTNGGAALKAEVVASTPQAVPSAENIKDPRVAAAMQRIDQSRKTFGEPHVKRAPSAKPQPRPFPFDVVERNDRPRAVPNVPPSAPSVRAQVPAKPKLVAPPRVSADLRRDTNRLPKLPAAAPVIERVEPISEPLPERPIEIPAEAKLPVEFTEIKRIQIKAEEPETPEIADVYEDEIEDLAPVSMRFGAGLFDLIIGAFISMLVLAPFALNGGDWFTGSGLLIATVVWAAVTFVYMTASLGFAGKTVGMRLFSLELVDALENEYPTLYQSAVNSSVFLLSLAFLGAGFITMFFNEERRALHDLLSGTILVREF